MAFPNGTFKSFSLDNVELLEQALPKIGHKLLFGFPIGGKTDVTDILNYENIGNIEILEATWSPNEYRIMIKHKSVDAYFIFNGVG